ncbi:sigma-54 interaction domain-containing protein [Niveibacterium sp.]|uniref:sigma-54 interaction domain-containing protein n=1 Tax=Niveibacterium sp. TaxID=2017444 RepID=UPI0035B1B966
MPTVPHPFPELLSLLDASPEPHIVFDEQYRILAANAAYRAQLAGGKSVVGKTCYQVSHHYTVPCDQAGETCPLARSRESGGRERVMHLHHTPRGEEYVDIELTPLRDASGEVRYFVERMAALPVSQGQDSSRKMVGRAPRFQRMLELVSRVAKSEATVLLEGESGSGKELVAQAIHDGSPRSKGPFVPVDCSGIPETLFESELFGHERGAFTGASASRAGLVEAASGGTLFLDEVGEIPLAMQVKLLRLLETGTYRRVGAADVRRADIRIVSATHRSLRDMVSTGAFRADLYYRLNTFPIAVPALRERPQDIAALAQALLLRVAPKRRLTISTAAQLQLERYAYPGNVRELRNLLERASLMCDGDTIEPEHLPDEIFAERCEVPTARKAPPVPVSERLPQLLAEHQGSRKSLAKALGISERTLYRRLSELERPDDAKAESDVPDDVL